MIFKRNNKMNIDMKYKISFVVMGMTVGVITLFCILLYQGFSKYEKKLFRNVADTVVEVNETALNDLLSRISITIGYINDNSTVHMEGEYDTSAISKMILSYENTEEIQSLKNILEEYSVSQKLFQEYFATCFGENCNYKSRLYVETDNDIHEFLPCDYEIVKRNGLFSSEKVTEQDWYQAGINSDGKIYWYLEENEPEWLYMVALLKYRQLKDTEGIIKEDNIGVLQIGFDISNVFDEKSENSFTEKISIFIQDENHETVYSDIADPIGSELGEKIKEKSEVRFEEGSYDGKKYFIYRDKMPLDLSVITVVEIAGNYTVPRDSVIIMLGAIMVAFLIATVVAVYFNNSIAKPLQKLAEHMEYGEMKTILYKSVQGKEIKSLFDSFNSLILKLIEEENKKMNALREKEQARFYALQVQINPHFVYNALNSVSCISMINGQEHVADALTNLAKIMRYSCRNPEDLVFVSEETEIIRVYEKLQKFCYWQTIDFSYDIEPDTEKYQIPKLIIQPLVENALIYGIESASNKVSVKLTIKKNGEYLLISVWDSGVNANLINLNRIAGGFAKEKRESLGIDNVQERLYVVYGEEASLVYSKDTNGNTIASIRIPIDKINT